MGEVVEEFRRELEGWRRRYAGAPRRELVRLLLLALEREQLVSIGYRETVLARRLQGLDVPPDVRELLRHALLWAWKDEEMHAIWVRGALLRAARGPLRVRCFVQQAMGAVAGWASAVRLHVRWREGLAARAAATLVTWAGRMAGKVPRAARPQLDYVRFREFCLFNVDAEHTAALCWERLVELAPTLPGISASEVQQMARMREDEDRHRRVFAILAGALDEHDGLRAGQDGRSLADALRAVGEPFLPRALRSGPDGGRLGAGGAVVVLEGTAGAKRSVLERALEVAGLEAVLAERAAECGRSLARLRIAVKPTFMIGYHRKDLSPVTDPELVGALVEWLRARGAGTVDVVEAPSIYDRFYAHRSVAEVARYLGFSWPGVRLVDSSADQVDHDYGRGMGQDTVCRAWRDADVRIAFGKMRSNPVDVATLALSTLEGLGTRHDAFFFPERQAHRGTAVMMIASSFPPHFGLLDAYDSAADGVAGMMGSPHPKAPHRIYAARDAWALDRVAARHMGADPEQVWMLRACRHWLGEPGPVQVIGTDAPIAGWRGPYHSSWTALLSAVAYPVYQFGSERGALFVPEMDEEAFPPLRPPGVALRMGRRAMQSLLGLRHPH